MHRTYLADIERGGRNVTLKSVANLARALQVSIEHLLSHSTTSSHGERLLPGLVEILLIEGNAHDADLILQAFRKNNLANPIKVVGNARDAFDYLNCTGRYAQRQLVAPQLVMLDLHLQDISGIEVLRMLKAGEKTRHIPVVVIGASENDQDIPTSQRLGASHHIVKPVGFDSFNPIAHKLNLQWALVNAHSRY